MHNYKPLLNTCLLVVGFWLSAFSAQGQSFVVSGKPLLLEQTTVLDAKFSQYDIVSLDATALSQYLRQGTAAKPVRLSVSGHDWSLVVRPNDVRTPQYQLLVGSSAGIKSMPTGENVTYAARFEHSPAIISALTVDNDFIDGYVKEGDDYWFIEPARLFQPNAPVNAYVVYNLKNVRPFEAKCAADYLAAETFEPNPPALTPEQSSVCKQVALGIATDTDLYLVQNSSAETVKNIVFSLINYMNVTYFASTFTDQIKFTITVFYLSTNSSNDPYSPNTNSTDASVLLNNFRTWGNSGGFSASFDLGMVYTARDVSNSVVGLAYKPGSCGSTLYQLDEYRGYPLAGMASVVAHETGHNFNACHDGDSGCSCSTSGTFVMSPSVNFSAPATLWSSCSVTTINSYYTTLSCITDCTTLGAPSADFYTRNTTACSNTDINFTDLSTNEPTAWSWSFTGASPTTASTSAPSTRWTTPGTYDVSLSTSNSLGSSTTAYKYGYVRVLAPPSSACVPTNGTLNAIGITRFVLNTIDHSSGSSTGDNTNYLDFSCAHWTQLMANTSYTVRVDLPDFAAIKMWIDYNDNGVLTDANEMVHASPSDFLYRGAYSFSFTTQSTFIANRFLRLRIRAYSTPSDNNPCSNYTTSETGQTEDYGVLFDAVLPVELTQFTATKTADRQVRVDWQTASEKNNAGFEVERSTDGQSFETIAKVAGKGQSTETTKYQAWDNAPNAGHNYYRLRQIDADGHETFSKTAYVWIAPEKGFLHVHPNPAQEALFVEFNNTESLTVVNMLGQVVKTVNTDNVPHVQQLVLDISALENGVYFLQTKAGHALKTVKFVKQ